jgi:deazaflavin-dependent oxidoreductase (nitroreductase family)
MKVGDDYVVTAANLGSEVDPAWYLNLVTNPRAEIEVGGRSVTVNARRAHGEEAHQLWERWVQRLPAADTFRHIAGREIPVIVLAPES